MSLVFSMEEIILLSGFLAFAPVSTLAASSGVLRARGFAVLVSRRLLLILARAFLAYAVDLLILPLLLLGLAFVVPYFLVLVLSLLVLLLLLLSSAQVSIRSVVLLELTVQFF